MTILRPIPLWYQLWQLRLEKTSPDRTTLNNGFCCNPFATLDFRTKHATYENP